LNFAIPTPEIISSIDAIRSGKNPANTKEAKPKKPDNPLTLDRLGIVLIPNVLDRTPPFVDDVRSGSPAAGAGIHADDLILLVDSQVVQSCAAVQKELSQIEADAEVRMTLMRGNDLVEVQLKGAQPQGQ
jgi:S1-C subfamily serine protease